MPASTSSPRSNDHPCVDNCSVCPLDVIIDSTLAVSGGMFCLSPNEILTSPLTVAAEGPSNMFQTKLMLALLGNFNMNQWQNFSRDTRETTSVSTSPALNVISRESNLEPGKH